MLTKLHHDEVDISEEIVRQLIDSQFPEWRDLPISFLESGGSSHAIFRLGNDKTIRIPRRERVAQKIEKESHFLPLLATHLPLTIPTPLAVGEPDKNFPWAWSIHQWIEGESATTAKTDDLHQAAKDLGHFVKALSQINPTDGPTPGEHNSYRGQSLIHRDPDVKDSIKKLEGMIDTEKALHVWENSLEQPEWTDQGVWIHGDLISENMLVKDGRLNAIIDFGCLGVGDPACDMMVAWTFLTNDTREIFRKIVDVDEATWERGRGWAVYFGVVALPYYKDTNPTLAGIARKTLDESLK